MKHIIKPTEPTELTDWKRKDKMYQRGQPKWNRVDSITKNAIRVALIEEQGYICCYCERELKNDDYHIEHLKPKGKNFFPELQLEYDNLLCSCQNDKIPKGTPRHCATARGSWYDETLFIAPLNSNCETQFKYTFDGHIKSNSTDDSGQETIKRLQLDIDKLVDLRNKAIEPFLDSDLSETDLQNFVLGYLVDKKNNGGKFNPFFTTIQSLFS